MVVALNMMDELRANGGSVDVNALERELGVPVVPIAAIKNEGVDELADHAMHVARYAEKPAPLDLCPADDSAEGAPHRCIHAIAHLVADHAERAGLPLRFAATKLVSGDVLVADELRLDPNEAEAVEHIVQQMEEEAWRWACSWPSCSSAWATAATPCPSSWSCPTTACRAPAAWASSSGRRPRTSSSAPSP
jgi:ferrous iron transport protein B